MSRARSPRSIHAPRARPRLLAIVVTLLWSSSWVLIRVGLDEEALPPLVFAGLRYSLAALVLAGFVVVRRRPVLASLGRADWVRVAVLGVLFYAVTQGAQFVAIAHQPAATSSLVLSLTPLLVVGASSATLGERPAAGQAVGAVLVGVGAWMYFAGGLGATALGLLASVIGLAANAGSALFGRSVNRDSHLPAVVVTATSMCVGAAVLLAAGVAVEGWPELTVRAWWLIGWLAVVNTAAAFTMWNASLRHLSAVESTGINNLMLIQIALLAWLFLDEAPGFWGIVGVVVVSAGVTMTQVSGMGRAGSRRDTMVGEDRSHP